MTPARTVFLSSTGKDLAEYRRAVDGMEGYRCVWQEDFGSRAWEADAFCRDQVARCDVFVGLIGHFHGSTPPGKEQSYTEREYLAAVAAGKPCLMFLATDDFPLPAGMDHHLVKPPDPEELWRLLVAAGPARAEGPGA